MKYKVGDKVRVKKGLEYGYLYGGYSFTSDMKRFEGMIREVGRVYPSNQAYRLEGVAGYLFTDEMLEPVTPAVSVPKPTWRIIIEGDENTSRAKYIVGKKVIKEATAKKHPDDAHNVGTAVRVLVDRLLPNAAKESEPPEYFSGRIVCVWCGPNMELTVGKIYEVKDGKLKRDNGIMWPTLNGNRIKTVERTNDRFGDYFKFIEIKE